MNVLGSIQQRSFGRYVMIDLLEAAARLGWATRWIDIEGRLFAARSATEEPRARAVDEVASELRASDPHVVFSYGLEHLAAPFRAVVPGDDRTPASIVRRPAVYFLFDFEYPLDRPVDATTRPYVEELQSSRSLVFCWDTEAVARLRALGITHARHFPMAVNEALFDGPATRVPGSPSDLPVLFAGGPTPERLAHLGSIAHLGLHVYGYEPETWRRHPALASCYRGTVMDRRELVALYGRARATVNVTRPHGRSSLNMRVYEAMACGCLVLTDDRQDARTLFEADRDLVVYDSLALLRRELARLLADEAARQRIAASGQARVRAEHTYARRLALVGPVIERFVREAALFDRLQLYAADDRARALRFVQYLELEGLVREHPDQLHVAVARLLLDAGQREPATVRLRKALATNPACLAAVDLARARGLPVV